MLLLSDSRTLAERNLPGGRHLLPLVDNSRQAAALPGTPAHRISQFCKKYFWKLQSSKVLPGWAGEPSPYQQPYQLPRTCRSPPSVKIICHPNPKCAISPPSIKSISDDEERQSPPSGQWTRFSWQRRQQRGGRSRRRRHRPRQRARSPRASAWCPKILF